MLDAAQRGREDLGRWLARSRIARRDQRFSVGGVKKSMSSWLTRSASSMHPVRRLGQALDTIQVGHILVVGLSELLTEVAVALPPNDQVGAERAKLRFGVLGEVRTEDR